MLRKISWTIAFILLALVVAGFFLPAHRHVERSVLVPRPASLVFTLLNSYRHFNAWSPWAARDPQARYRFSGPDAGAGARMDWNGDPRVVGTGWQRITDSEPYRRITVHLDFGEQGTAQSAYLLEPVESGTRVTWSFDTDVTEGKSVFGSLVGRYFGLFLERWIGADYEQGLASLSTYAASFPDVDFSSAKIEIINTKARQLLYVPGSSSQEATDVAAALAEAFGKIIAYMAEENIELVGQPMAITRGWEEGSYQFEAALPVDRLPETENEEVMAGMSPSGPAVRLVHIGPYDQMLESYAQLDAYMAAHQLTRGDVSWEDYVSDPGTEPPDELVTHIYYLIEPQD